MIITLALMAGLVQGVQAAGSLAGPPAASASCQGRDSYDGIRELYRWRKGEAPSGRFGRLAGAGRVFSGPGDAGTPAFLLGPGAGGIPASLVPSLSGKFAIFKTPAPGAGGTAVVAEQGAGWTEGGLIYNLREWDSCLFLEVRRPGAAETQYAVFQELTDSPPAPGQAGPPARQGPLMRESAALDALKEGSPFSMDVDGLPGGGGAPMAPVPSGEAGHGPWSVSGRIFVGSDFGNDPLFPGSHTEPYLGPRVGGELEAKWREQRTLLPGVDLKINSSYAPSSKEAESGRFGLSVESGAWLLNFLRLGGGYWREESVNPPSGPALELDPRQRLVGLGKREATFGELRLAPLGMDAENAFELWTRLFENPSNHRPLGRNSWPSRMRGEGPPLGWQTGIDTRYILAKAVDFGPIIGLPLRIQDVRLDFGASIGGGTAWDDPEMARISAGLSARLAEYLTLKVAPWGQFNINRDVRYDPAARTRSSGVHGIMVELSIPIDFNKLWQRN